jgi:hypothetical protein
MAARIAEHPDARRAASPGKCGVGRRSGRLAVVLWLLATPLLLPLVSLAQQAPDESFGERMPERAVRPESVRPESVRPESVRPESVRPESVRPESVRPETGAAEPEGGARDEGLHFNLIPILYYTPETRTGYGIGTWLIQREPGDSGHGHPDNLWLSAEYTQLHQSILQAIPELYFRHGTYRLQMRLRYHRFPTRFYGIGNDTPEADKEQFTPVMRAVRVAFTRRLYADLSAGGLADYSDIDIVQVEPGRRLATGSVPGSQGSRVGGVGILVRWDSREQHFAPRAGSLLELTSLRYSDLDAQRYHFTRSELDVRGYLPLLEGHVLSLRLLLQSVSGVAPFTALPQLGGKFLLRGYYEGRYRDNELLALQAEYRAPLGGRWGATGFLGEGQVAPRLAALHGGGFKPAGGLGLRYAWDRRERINLRLDVASGRGTSGAYFSVGEAF